MSTDTRAAVAAALAAVQAATAEANSYSYPAPVGGQQLAPAPAAQQDLAALVAAVVRQLPAAAPAAPQHAACGCQHQHGHQAANRSVARPLAIGGAVVVGGAVLTSLFLAVALASVGVAIGALVAFLLVREIRKGGAR